MIVLVHAQHASLTAFYIFLSGAMQQQQLDQFDAIEMIREIKANTEAYRRYQDSGVLHLLNKVEG
jgi:hypothetical protein